MGMDNTVLERHSRNTGNGTVLRTERVTVTPELAASLLAANVNNRPVAKAHVQRLAAAMSRGEWDVNGSTIKVATTGKLLDGQHRLLACVESGCSFITFIVYGLSESCFSTIDQNARGRKISDVLSIEAGANMKNVAAALMVVYQLRTLRQVTSNAKDCSGFSVAVARELFAKHPMITESAAASNSTVIYRTAQCAALHYLFGLVDGALANDFTDVLRSGSSDLRRPFNMFREGLIRCRRSSAVLNRRDSVARAIKAFNAERIGKSVFILGFRSNEEFPLIDGLDYESL